MDAQVQRPWAMFLKAKRRLFLPKLDQFEQIISTIQDINYQFDGKNTQFKALN